MSSSTVTQRWLSTSDLATSGSGSKHLASFFLQSSALSCSEAFPPRSSQSSVLRLDSSPSPPSFSPSPPPPPIPARSPCSSKQSNKSVSSRVADIISQFESQNQPPANDRSKLVSCVVRRNSNKSIESDSSQRETVVSEKSAAFTACNSNNTNKPQVIIVYERIDRPNKSEHVRPLVTFQCSSAHTLVENHKTCQQLVESDSDSAIHTMTVAIEKDVSHPVTLSRSSTTDSNCSSLSSSVSPQYPHSSLPVVNMPPKPRDESVDAQRRQSAICPSPSSLTTSIQTSSVASETPETPQAHSFSTRHCVSEANLADQYNRLASSDAIQSDTNLSQNSAKKYFVNRNLPLRYKRESIIRLYGPDALLEIGRQHSHDVVLEDDIDPPFAPRNVQVQKNKKVADQYELMETLGRGKFGEVKRCREKTTSHMLAAKFLPINREQDRVEAFNEIEIMKALQHPRLLQLYDAFETKSDICLIMELITGGELFERVIDDDFILTERLCELYMMQICEGVDFMHSCNIIHLDMKPENVLCLNRNGHRIKIIDFGLARKFDPNTQLKVLFGTPEFVAPEVINFDRIGFGTDMWSVGVICYVLLSGLSPFMGENDNETYTNINRVNYDFDDEAFADISDEAKDFISKLLLKNKDQRLKAKECLAHPWLIRRPKSVSTPNEEETAEKKLSTKKLRRFVIRRRWQKAVNALLALKRMGMTL